MEQVHKLVGQLEKSVFADLDRISELCVCEQNEISQLSDNIKLNLSSYLTELRFFIDNKSRLREIVTKANSELIRYHGCPAVFISAKVTNPSTTRAKAMSAAYWNISHDLNCCINTPVNEKNITSATLVAALIAATQINEIGGRSLYIMSHLPSLKKIVDHLPLYNAQNYLDREGSAIKHAPILRKLFDTGINMMVLHNPDQRDAPIVEIFEKMGNFARGEIEKQFK